MERLNRAYFDWRSKVERHIHITEAQEMISAPEREIIEGLSQTKEVLSMSPDEMEQVITMLKIIREK